METGLYTCTNINDQLVTLTLIAEALEIERTLTVLSWSGPSLSVGTMALSQGPRDIKGPRALWLHHFCMFDVLNI